MELQPSLMPSGRRPAALGCRRTWRQRAWVRAQTLAEIGAVRIRDGAVARVFFLVKLSRPIPPFITFPDRHHSPRWWPMRTRSHPFWNTSEWSGLELDSLNSSRITRPLTWALRRAARACARSGFAFACQMSMLALARLAPHACSCATTSTVASYFGTAPLFRAPSTSETRRARWAEILLSSICSLPPPARTDVEDLIVLTNQVGAPPINARLRHGPAGLPGSITSSIPRRHSTSMACPQSRGQLLHESRKAPEGAARMVSGRGSVISLHLGPPHSGGEDPRTAVRHQGLPRPITPGRRGVRGSQHWVIAEADRPCSHVSPVTLDDLPNAPVPGTRARTLSGLQGDRTSSPRPITTPRAPSSTRPWKFVTSGPRRAHFPGWSACPRRLLEAAAGARDELSACYITGVERNHVFLPGGPGTAWGARRDGGEPGWILHVASYGRHQFIVAALPTHRRGIDVHLHGADRDRRMEPHPSPVG